MKMCRASINMSHLIYRGPAPFHRLTPNKRFEPVFSTVIMALCSLFNRMLLLTDLIPVHLLYCGQTVMIGCNHTSFEWTRAVRHIYGIIRHMQGLYKENPLFANHIPWALFQLRGSPDSSSRYESGSIYHIYYRPSSLLNNLYKRPISPLQVYLVSYQVC